jgi:hypothetical protein
VQFSRELRSDVLAGDITISIRLWQRPQVKRGGRYRVGPGEIEIDAIELLPFAAITAEDVRRSGEPDRETLRRRRAGVVMKVGPACGRQGYERLLIR